MSRITINGLEHHYEVSGQGLPLLLLGDKGWSCEIWKPFAAVMEKQYTVIIPEYRGCGRTNVGDTEITVSSLMEDIATIMTELSLYNVVIMGVGLGGKIALMLADAYPEHVESLIISNTTHGGPQGEVYSREMLELLFLLGSDTEEKIIDTVASKWLSPNTDENLRQWLINRLQHDFPTKAVYQQLLYADAGCDLTEQLRKIKPRIMIIAGCFDVLIEQKSMCNFRWLIPNNHYKEIQGGHLCLLTNALECSNAIQDWLDMKNHDLTGLR